MTWKSVPFSALNKNTHFFHRNETETYIKKHITKCHVAKGGIVDGIDRDNGFVTRVQLV